VIEARELDLIAVAGKTEPVRVYEAMGRVGEFGPERSELRETFAAGLAAYRTKDWDAAQTQFEGCLRIAAEDGPAQLFLDRVARLRDTPPPADWDGIWRLSAK
jgi:adenylate cyclase